MNTRESVGKSGWKAMPSRPSSPPEATRSVMSRYVVLTGLDVSNCFTTPGCSSTNQRELSAGACSIKTGALKERLVNWVKEIRLPALGRGQARQVALPGRESRPAPLRSGRGVDALAEPERAEVLPAVSNAATV